MKGNTMFVVKGGNWKFHSASTKDIAKEIMRDLQERDPESQLIVENGQLSGDFHVFDPGGPVISDGQWSTLVLKDSELTLRDQHLSMLRDMVNSSHNHIRGQIAQYYKIKGNLWCICLTIEEFHQLKKLLNSAEYLALANAAWDDWDNRMNTLNEEQVILKAQQTEDGKVQVAKSVSKSLN